MSDDRQKDIVRGLKGFKNLTAKRDRALRLAGVGLLDLDKADDLAEPVKDEWTEILIENGAGVWEMPIGYAFIPVNGKIRLAIVGIEETSVLAALSKVGIGLLASRGVMIKSECIGDHFSIGQIVQITNNDKVDTAIVSFVEVVDELIHEANTRICQNDVARGGGVMNMEIKKVYQVSDTEQAIVIHVYLDTDNAMGANKVIDVCEFMAPIISEKTGTESLLKILTNDVSKLVEASVVIPEFDPVMGRRIELASRVAEQDLGRAVTSNKGVGNAIYGIGLATGNDTRALLLGIQTYAMKSGVMSLTKWRYSEGTLSGSMCVPVDVGVVGGATMHPKARRCLRAMNVSTAKELRMLTAATGLVSNLAALLALVDPNVNFSVGHMSLQTRNIAVMAGAGGDEVLAIAEALAILKRGGRTMNVTTAMQLLEEMRGSSVCDCDEGPSSAQQRKLDL